jgi:dihydroxyacetone kinase
VRADVVGRLLGAVGESLRAAKDELNGLDGRAGDGDLGDTLAAACVALEAEAAGWPGEEDLAPAEVLARVSATLRRAAPSSFGSLVALGLRAAGKALAAGGDDAASVLAALDAGIEEIKARGRAEVGDRTVLDALVPALESARAALAGGAGGVELWRRATEGASAGAERTAEMAPKVGRASWVGERAVGEVDAGARVAELVLSAMAEAIAPAGS